MSFARFSVIAADDHPIVLSGIRLALGVERDFELLAAVGDSDATLAAIRQQVPDLLILDLWMGNSNGLDLIRMIHEEWPTIRVLVYSMNDEIHFGVRALRAGASGYLMKSHGLDELLKALRIVAAGGRYISPALADDLISRGLHSSPADSKPASLSMLTDREIQILRLIGRGQTTAAISRDLGISVKTVGAHRENLKNKLDARDAAELMRKAVLLVDTRVL
jgi:DNA-binding NarL/FixJ family response regulator